MQILLPKKKIKNPNINHRLKKQILNIKLKKKKKNI